MNVVGKDATLQYQTLTVLLSLSAKHYVHYNFPASYVLCKSDLRVHGRRWSLLISVSFPYKFQRCRNASHYYWHVWI